MRRQIIVCSRKKSTREIGGPSGGVKNAQDISTGSSVEFYYLRDMNSKDKLFLFMSTIFSKTVVVAHDIESCVFLGLKRPHLVYHSQGKTVNEIQMYVQAKFYHFVYYWAVEKIALILCRSITTPTKGSFSYFASQQNLWSTYLRRKLTEPLFGLYLGISGPKPPRRLKKDETIKLLTVSDFLDSKNITSLPSLIKKIFSKQNFVWTIVGRGPQEEQLRDQIELNYIADKTTIITDFISDKEMNDLYRKSDIFLMNHKVAICDRAIGQAMYHSLDIILSKKPSSVELNVRNNILFWSELETFEEIVRNNIERPNTKENYDELWSPSGLSKRYEALFKINLISN